MSLSERLSQARRQNGKSENTTKAPRRPTIDLREVEAEPDPLATLKKKTHQALVKALGPKLYDAGMTAEQLEQHVRSTLKDVLSKDKTPLTAVDRARLISETADDVLGYGPLEPLLKDPTVTEVMVNGPHTVYVERQGKLLLTPARFLDDGHLRRTIEKIVGRIGRRIDESQPYVDARLPDGSRVNATIPPVSIDGPSLTVRKFSAEPYTADDLIRFDTWNTQASEFLRACVEGRVSLLVSGGTGAGKTTTLNVLSGFIPTDERIITIEDAAELRLQKPHIVRLEYRPPNIEGAGEVTIRDLVRNALRMRPNRIVVGEVRGREAMDMLQAMNTGHEGSISTIHANSPRDALSRLETMCLMAGMDLPVRAIREQASSAIALIVHQARLKDGTRRITHITEVTGMEGDVITLQDLFVFDYRKGVDADGRYLGHLQSTGLRPAFSEKLSDAGIKIDADWFARMTSARGGRR